MNASLLRGRLQVRILPGSPTDFKAIVFSTCETAVCAFWSTTLCFVYFLRERTFVDIFDLGGWYFFMILADSWKGCLFSC
ncbi:hypothetical protein SAMN04488037_101518 [Shimia marina]|uniref:Uncharacterized protein n=1 Tax=Shimia marina TaxID=321267 RepID=A0A0P1EL12_9RHOB|nr:hypothetical protein SHM7688_00588 [Shimia marina]SFD56576.1 hypothetical protein SAMN04488037_101518 [Shimia marina]